MKLIIFAVILSLSGCASTNIQLNKEDVFDIHYSYSSLNGNRLDGHTEQGLKLMFPSIPGKIFGSPSANIVSTVVPKNSKQFSLVLPSNTSRYASEFSVKDLVITPSNTKIFRLGTFYSLPKGRNKFGGAGFKSVDDGSFIILVYFSKPATVTGSIAFGPEKYNHNIEIDSAGWEWIQVLETEENTFELKTYSGDIKDIELSLSFDTQ